MQRIAQDLKHLPSAVEATGGIGPRWTETVPMDLEPKSGPGEAHEIGVGVLFAHIFKGSLQGSDEGIVLSVLPAQPADVF